VGVLTLDSRDRTPIYVQLERGIRAAIAAGRLAAGAQLPTVRQLAVELRINANTVARVYGELERAGVLETRRGVGTFVSATPVVAHPPHDRDRRVRAFATRVLADAAAAGIGVDDLLAALEAYRTTPQATPLDSPSARGPTESDQADGSRADGHSRRKN
jgi:GntR family transcriptional regulator